MSAKLYFYFKKNPLQFLQMSGLNVVINNKDIINIKANKEYEYEIEEGNCRIQMSMPYLGGETGTASVDLDVKDGERYLLTYKMPLTVLTSGTILVKKK